MSIFPTTTIGFFAPTNGNNSNDFDVLSVLRSFFEVCPGWTKADHAWVVEASGFVRLRLGLTQVGEWRLGVAALSKRAMARCLISYEQKILKIPHRAVLEVLISAVTDASTFESRLRSVTFS
ncbi:hypothetical protein CY34DRAFT_800572 [Suillus luteus UH-Slu-Lm8-n1]|uniref:Uncharacterized protein n=1 Tax=Suillus luteus UH-Slu-Lm8-n1 TaxID=930992 RepID=A0A0D0B8W0_9AGAM|nr:hypothetical protein CY34DRAFT_800572 [Suillus luteus UH-Slu-Lm8-n1]